MAADAILSVGGSLGRVVPGLASAPQQRDSGGCRLSTVSGSGLWKRLLVSRRRLSDERPMVADEQMAVAPGARASAQEHIEH